MGMGVGRVWISSANAAKVAAKNFRIVHGPSDFFYLVRITSLHCVDGRRADLTTM